MRNKKIESAWKLLKIVKFIGRSDHTEIWECGDYKVIYSLKPGRELAHCDCKNATNYCNENPECKHKMAVNFVRMLKFRNVSK